MYKAILTILISHFAKIHGIATKLVRDHIFFLNHPNFFDSCSGCVAGIKRIQSISVALPENLNFSTFELLHGI